MLKKIRPQCKKTERAYIEQWQKEMNYRGRFFRLRQYI